MIIGIVTLNGYENYGNRLQNYALQQIIENIGFKAYTLWPVSFKQSFKYFLKILIPFKSKYKKNKALYLFSKKYIRTKYYININTKVANKYDYFICGSDQVWNCNFKTFNTKMFLEFSPKEKNIAYAASFGINKIEKKYEDIYLKGLNNFKSISVRESEGKQIIQKLDKSLKVDAVLDPTLMIDKSVWNNIASKPAADIPDKYILVYMLGKNNNIFEAIEKTAKEKNWIVINLMNEKSQYYSIGPAEFLYLIKNAELVCTDSFHACVFSLIFNRSFVVFDRVNKNNDMSSRLETLLKKFRLDNRKFNGQYITQDNIIHDYSNAYKILKEEQDNSIKFLRESLDL